MKPTLALVIAAVALMTLESCSCDRRTGAYQQTTTTATTSRYSGK
jgi:hypothetical protein